MASLEPPIPATAARRFDGSLDDEAGLRDEERGLAARWNARANHGGGGGAWAKWWIKWRRFVGLLLLFLTVFLWTVSNFLASVSAALRALSSSSCYHMFTATEECGQLFEVWLEKH